MKRQIKIKDEQNYTVIEWTRPKLDRLKQAISTAKANKQEQFAFEGQDFVTANIWTTGYWISLKLPEGAGQRMIFGIVKNGT